MFENDIASRRNILSKRRAGLPDEEQALLDKWLQGKANVEAEISQPVKQSVLTSTSGQWSISVLQMQIASELEQVKNKMQPLPSLVPIQINDSNNSPFFLVHPGSGDITDYAKMVHYLKPELSFYGLRAQGLDGLKSPYTQIETMASYYIAQILTVQSKGPYLLGGWSMGGVIAFEMARQLQMQGRAVRQLILIDSHRPTVNQETVINQADPIINFALNLGLPLRQIKPNWVHLETVSFREKLNYILEETKLANLFSSDITLPQIWYRFQVFMSNLQAMDSYIPGTYAGPITLFKASKQFDNVVNDLGWQTLTTGNLTIQTIPGDHYTIMREPNIKELAKKLNSV